MLHLHWDCRTGAAGDMLLASLLAAGAEESALRQCLAGVGLGHAGVRVSSVMRAGIGALHVEVDGAEVSAGLSPGEPAHRSHAHPHVHAHPPSGVPAHPDAAGQPEMLPHDHPHEGAQTHAHHHPHAHPHKQQGTEPRGTEVTPSSTLDAQAGACGHAHAGEHRHLQDMLALADRLDASEAVREKARRVFTLLAEAEGAIHGVPIEQVHFHEISGLDTAVDVLGVCWAFEALGIRSCSATPVSMGGGTVTCAHGVLPVPAPATLEIVRRAGIPIRSGPVERELCTPTGAALLAVLVDRFETCVSGRVCGTGYGAGTLDFATVPNVVRAILVEPEREEGGAPEPDSEWIYELVTVVDDVTAEEVAYALERCLASGALDAYTVPATMKKGRQGMEVTVLASAAEADRLTDLLFRHTATLGVRQRRVRRRVLCRDERVVTVEGHAVRVKRVCQGGDVLRVKAEYEDCRRVAEVTGMPFTVIRRHAERMACPREGGGCA